MELGLHLTFLVGQLVVFLAFESGLNGSLCSFVHAILVEWVVLLHGLVSDLNVLLFVELGKSEVDHLVPCLGSLFVAHRRLTALKQGLGLLEILATHYLLNGIGILCTG